MKHQENRRKIALFDIFDIVAFLVFIIWIVLCIRLLVFTPFSVVGLSMYPTFKEGDFIIVDKITPNFGELQRWDVVVFVPPGKDIPYIKRIIWLPWETVHVQSGTVEICSSRESCEILDEPYLSETTDTEAKCGNTFEVTGGYFVMGDNRERSTDSRCCFGMGCFTNSTHTVPQDHILWKVYIRLFPGFTTSFSTQQ